MRRVLILLWLGLVVMVVAVACTEDLPIPTLQPTSPPPINTATNTPEPPTLTPSPTPEPQAALVNGQPILLADYEHQVARYEASMVAAGEALTTTEGQEMLAQGREWVLDMMIDQVLIEAAATEAGITVSDDEVETAINTDREEVGEDAFKTWLADNGISLEALYEQQRDEMVATRMASLIAADVPTRTEHVHARHILVSTEEEAQQILSQVQAGAEFVTLARTYSQDTSTRDTGGDLKFFPQGVLTSLEVSEAAFALQPGQVSSVVQSELGYHIVQVVERAPDMEVTPENLRLLRSNAVRTWLEGLRTAADIQRFVSATTAGGQ